jgi:hypothetical protein
MTYLIRAAFFALSLATITPVANAAATVNTVSTPIQQDWANG